MSKYQNIQGSGCRFQFDERRQKGGSQRNSGSFLCDIQRLCRIPHAQQHPYPSKRQRDFSAFLWKKKAQEYQQGTVKPTKIKVNDGCAIIYTFQDMDYPPRDVEPKKGYTVFYDHLGNKLISITSGSRVDSGSKKGADGPMSETFTGIAGGYRSSNCKIAYGTTKILHTDRRLRWIHGGGGGSTKNPAPAFREHQPWRVTMGCTRAQNIDLENLAALIS